jgi:YggT family protein
LYLIIASVIMSWLIAFDVLNTRNRWVYKICSLIGRATNPGMAYVRRFLPPMGGIDLSPMVLIFGIYLLQSFLYGLR